MDENKKMMSRRALIERSAAMGLVVLGASFASACGSSGPKCDGNDVNEEQRNLRRTLGYKEEWPDATKRCQLCNFFPAGAPTSQCGTCALNLGQVNPKGGCTSFALRG